MSRAIAKQCQHCAILSVETAKALHGAGGDGCWNPKICHRRRSHYRHRQDSNQRRKGQRAMAAVVSKSGAAVEQVSVPAPLAPVALLYLYRENREAPLHAVGVAVWTGDRKLAEVTPIHCLGLVNRQVNHYLKEVLKALSQKYGIEQFKQEIYLDPKTCPIQPCPLQGM